MVIFNWLYTKWFFYIIILILALPPVIYRFQHPEKTETQLFLDFFKSYKEFFNS